MRIYSFSFINSWTCFKKVFWFINQNSDLIIFIYVFFYLGVGSNLKSRLSTDLSQNMEVQQKEMMDRMTALLPSEKQTVSRYYKSYIITPTALLTVTTDV